MWALLMGKFVTTSFFSYHFRKPRSSPNGPGGLGEAPVCWGAEHSERADHGGIKTQVRPPPELLFLLITRFARWYKTRSPGRDSRFALIVRDSVSRSRSLIISSSKPAEPSKRPVSGGVGIIRAQLNFTWQMHDAQLWKHGLVTPPTRQQEQRQCFWPISHHAQ